MDNKNNESNKVSVSLADRCFDSDRVSDQLFNTVNSVLECDTEKCLEEGFVWGATDTCWDYYDCSVEVVRPAEAKWMSREQANQILDLGFSCVFESIGDKAIIWYRDSHGGCSSREGDEKRRLRAMVAALRSENAALKAENQELKRTVRLAYLDALDQVPWTSPRKTVRLTENERVELGRRLAQYGIDKPETNPTIDTKSTS